MTPKCDEFPWDGCTESISVGEEEIKLSSNKFVVFHQTFPDKSTSKLVCSAQWDSCVYKRKKLVLLPEENATIPNGSFCHHLQKKAVIYLRSHIESVDSVPNSACSSICSIREYEEPEQLFTGDIHKYASECYSSVNEMSSSSKPSVGHGSTSTKIATEDSEECSSCDNVIVEPLRMFTSVKELCIFVLKSHGLLGGEWTSSSCTSLEDLRDNNHKLSQSCKICGLPENPIKMLICDLCEEAFHLSCCKPKVKVLPDYEWHCQPCFKKKLKTLRKKRTRKSSETVNSRKRISPGESLVSLMLKAGHPYTSEVRIGKDFQAEVPDWSGPIYDTGELARLQLCKQLIPTHHKYQQHNESWFPNGFPETG